MEAAEEGAVGVKEQKKVAAILYSLNIIYDI